MSAETAPADDPVLDGTLADVAERITVAAPLPLFKLVLPQPVLVTALIARGLDEALRPHGLRSVIRDGGLVVAVPDLRGGAA